MGLPSTSTKGAKNDRSERAMLNLSLLLPFIAFERAAQGLKSMCRGIRIENPYIKKSPFTSLPEAPHSYVNSGRRRRLSSHWMEILHQLVTGSLLQLCTRLALALARLKNAKK